MRNGLKMKRTGSNVVSLKRGGRSRRSIATSLAGLMGVTDKELITLSSSSNRRVKTDKYSR